MDSTDVFDRIRHLLDSNAVLYRIVEHPPTHTSEESAQARGEPLEVGGKAILLKAGERFCLLVLSAARRLDSAAVKRELGVKKLRFATTEELDQATGLVPGSVPPFGPPVLPFDLHVDESVRENVRIAFNAGSLTRSIILATDDYLRIAAPSSIFRFTKD